MLIRHSGDIIREIQFDEKLTNVGQNPQPWQFKEFYDAATTGVEFIWPYSNFEYPGSPPGETFVEKLSKDFFGITFQEHIRVMEMCNLFIFPHYSIYIAGEGPFPIVQSIEFDWWPGLLRVIFLDKPCLFEKGRPFAQGVVLPRRDYTVKRMSSSETTNIAASNDFARQNADSYITRRAQEDGFELQTNLYERLSQLNQLGQLPPEVKRSKLQSDIRCTWK
jgi:hypothetical protein